MQGVDQRQWFVVDGDQQIVGRMATRIATILRGKHKPSFTPHVDVGDYVIVHVGFAISKVDEDEAKQVFEYLEAMDDLAELEIAQPDAP